MANKKTSITSTAKTTENETSKSQAEDLKKLKQQKKEADEAAESAKAKAAAEKKAAEEAQKKAEQEKKDAEEKAKKEADKVAKQTAAKTDAVIDAGASLAMSAFKSGKKKGGFVQGLILGVLVGALGMFLIGKLNSAPMVLGSEAPVESHDVTIENNGVLGYTAADFQNAVLGAASQHAELVVMEQPLEISTTVTKAGLGNLSIFSKVKTVTYYGTGVYTVDLKGIDESAIAVDQESYTVTVSIPHTTLQYVEPDLKKTEFEDTEKGLLAFGDMKLTMEEQNELESSVDKSMRERLQQEDLLTQADDYAKMKTWELFQPLISSVSPEYKVDTVFKD